MGALVVKAVAGQDDMEVVGGFDPLSTTGAVELADGSSAPAFTDLALALRTTTPDVLVDFTSPNAVEGNLRVALAAGVDCVVGTTGLTKERLEELVTLAPGSTTLFYAPNFTLGAVLMMAFAEKAARYFPDAEVIEFHHNGKKDAPSGTAITTALAIARARGEAGGAGLTKMACAEGSGGSLGLAASGASASRAPGKETELPGCEGARGADVEGVPVHSVRSNGFFAHQEVIFGSSGETLTLRHDSIDRAAYMPGVLLAIREVGTRSGLIVGLDQLLDL
jgi:4-hydroxy-tetrahydrodipicolinate reductase